MLRSILKAWLGDGPEPEPGFDYQVAIGCAIHGCKVTRAKWGGRAYIEAGPTILPVVKVDARVYSGDEKPVEWDWYDPSDEDQQAEDWKLV